MSIVGGLDIHRKQLTFDYLDTASGEVRRGQICPADRAHLAAWLEGRFTGETARLRDGGVHRVEVCGRGAGRGRDHPARRRACGHRRAAGPQAACQDGQDRFRHLRVLLADGRLPECWIPPSHVLECRALLELYHDLRTEHAAGCSGSRGAVPPGRPGQLGEQGAAHRARAWPRLRSVAAARTIAGRATADHSGPGHAAGAGGPPGRAAPPADRGGPAADRGQGAGTRGCTASARPPRWRLCCWLGGAGRFSSARKAVRFTGLDITVWSSDRKGPPGRLSRQGRRSAALVRL